MPEPAPSPAEARLIEAARGLSCFVAPSDVRLLEGGKTNHNVLVTDQGRRFVVRFGSDIPEHGILRWNELAITRAAERAEVGPAVRHAEPGLLVLDYVEARPLTPADRDDPLLIPRLADLVARVHRDVTRVVSGPVLCFCVPHILRDYARLLTERGSPHAPLLPGLLARAEDLDRAIGPFEPCLCHNDLLPGNILIGDSGIWLIDWEYGGFGNPLFDLGGITSNNGFSPPEERLLLEAYHDRPLTDAQWRSYSAMKCASLLRETLWSMVSELTLTLDFDYAAYTAENLAAFDAAFQDFRTL
ncbi:choline kinase family protein [Rhodobacter calidifons]|uniref:Phosphotransferase n=1 Tax=Rhodobacter calidifons TaxID=2715277 RepID=A0ABX0GBY7_9RHOB|nr:choline kinase family protein [Rhodobacter calidifons]NHB78136.1 phosphotransferase [Rhodobacter calidifons]